MYVYKIRSLLMLLLVEFKLSWCTNEIRGTSLPIGNMSLPSGNRSSRTLYGLLGLLAGYPPSAPAPAPLDTDYGQDVAKHFWPKLHVLQQKYPLLFAPSLPPPHPLSPPPTQYFPPFWYPPFIVIPVGNNPVNQQQIVNLHEPLASDNSLNDNYQELHEHNTQTFNNNIHPVKNPTVENSNPKLDTKRTKLNFKETVEQESKTEDNALGGEEFNNVTDININLLNESLLPLKENIKHTTKKPNNHTTSTSTPTNRPQTNITETTKTSTIENTTSISPTLTSTPPTVAQNSTISNNFGPYYYPKPVGNRLDIDAISITPSVPQYSGDLTRLPYYNEFSNGLNEYYMNYDNAHSDYTSTHIDKKSQQFYPMIGHHYDTLT